MFCKIASAAALAGCVAGAVAAPHTPVISPNFGMAQYDVVKRDGALSLVRLLIIEGPAQHPRHLGHGGPPAGQRHDHEHERPGVDVPGQGAGVLTAAHPGDLALVVLPPQPPPPAPPPAGGGGPPPPPRRSHASRLSSLSGRERQVLALIAEGRSNQAIAQALHLSAASIEKHVSAIFLKLGLAADEHSNRRVLAALVHVAEERTLP